MDHRRKKDGPETIAALAVHERDLFKRLWHLLDIGDVAFTDRGFCSFADIYHYLLGADCVMRKHQARKTGEKLFKTDNIIIVTTLLDHKNFPAHKFAELYLMRGPAELYLRDIKITMNMDILRGKTPEMVEKELCRHVIAYNLIRSVMNEAAQPWQVPLDRISFKETV